MHQISNTLSEDRDSIFSPFTKHTTGFPPALGHGQDGHGIRQIPHDTMSSFSTNDLASLEAWVPLMASRSCCNLS